jgi:Flp pilus assembly protein TadG
MFAWRRRHDRRDPRGAAAVETVLCLCFIVLPLVFGTIAYGYMLSFRQALSQATAEAARAAVGAPTDTLTLTSAQTAIGNALATYDMACANNVLTRHGKVVTGSSCTVSAATTTGCSTGHTCVSVRVSYPYSKDPLLPTFPGLGFTLPKTLSFTTVVQVS